MTQMNKSFFQKGVLFMFSKLYVLDGGMDPENFQFFDEWKEHRVFKLTLSDLEELN